ncbi:MAG: sigma-70 region 4 domain-containing protein [Candidatus Heimdallarchaeum aukensis]|uniref:Sigma-70 region 4 domain-containing protein n=1 Tax=Candidatus Heimdallarchaeum aukensis TaxID=2876573 RepID=A0A9Y1BMN5_9ARCH|nr:MAG: sigma-70 region 4 domain-containing protein [Candidatus Heimdallarchaeum aukensis]
MKFSILVKNEDHKEFLPKIPESIKHLKLFINMEIRRASLVILFSFKRKDSIKEEVQELDFLETVSKLVNLGYFSDINPVSSVLSDKQFLCFYLHDILDFKSEEIAKFTQNSPSTIRDHLSNARKRITAFSQILTKMNLEFTILNNLSAIPLESLKKLTSSMRLFFT